MKIDLTSFREIIIMLGVILLLSAFIFLTQFDGWTTIKDWFRPDGKLTIRSLDGAVYTNRKTRIVFENPQVYERVVWLVDSERPFLDSKEIEYIFEYDSTQPDLARTTHRVDVFYRIEDRFKTIRQTLEVVNFNPATLTFSDSSSLVFKISSGYALTSAAIQTFESGKFSKVEDLVIERGNIVALEDLNHRYRWIEYTLQDSLNHNSTFVMDIGKLTDF